MQDRLISQYAQYLQELEDAGFTKEQAKVMLSIWLDLLGKDKTFLEPF